MTIKTYSPNPIARLLAITAIGILILGFGELVKRCRMFRGDTFRSRPRIDRIARHIG
jgi:hypothetical protein